ncbi:MAG: ferredoxin-type protein NapF [Aliivibrio sp.]|uniref:ferredoxin-type protein NapF n=1 Tax=Aliivibrio sp. TaxID=1872443 RepID=UPI001A554CD4|nr:ferredoxin-type protein NapF [Aliivibrio sp.]
MVDLSKRRLFRRSSEKGIDTQQRMPWIHNQAQFTDDCTRCGKCLDICETNIIIKGDGGFPAIDFTKGECTFCKKCSDVCPEALFDLDVAPVWLHKVTINSDCLATKSVECRSCSELCEPMAIKFQLTIGNVAQPRLDLDKCTGCGACVAICPVSAISMKL